MTFPRWFLTADDREARLFSIEASPGGHVHVEILDARRGEDHHERERGRPSELGDRPYGGEEERRRFASEIRTWAAEVAAERGISRLPVFAAPRMMGELRSQLEHHPIGVGQPHALQIELHPSELGGLNPSELADHPAIRGLMLPRWADVS
jgi:protein required for attachment to host cells